MNVVIGEVVAVSGVKVSVKVFEESNKDTLFYYGKKYKGVSIREYISIARGFRDIICVIEGEYLDERKFEKEGEKFSYVRMLDARPVGFFENGRFYEGIKYLPLIKDKAAIIPVDKVSEIYGGQGAGFGEFSLGRLLKEDVDVSLPWMKLFNTHIGIFGNTGSGKSNTLAKLYTLLFREKIVSIRGKSRFVLIDFNGEYTGEQLLSREDKAVVNLSTRTAEGAGRFFISPPQFWDIETLGILFQATANTQRPFLNRILSGRERYQASPTAFSNYIKRTFRQTFSTASSKAEALDLLRGVAALIGASDLQGRLGNISWNARQSSFYTENGRYFNADGLLYDELLNDVVNEAVDSWQGFDDFDELIVRINLQLSRDLNMGFVQFEHIQPLLKRIESRLENLRKVIAVRNHDMDEKTLTVISLRRCSQDMKKVIPLLVAKHFYQEHQGQLDTNRGRTLHLIIDEAHNILSQQSAREHEVWKDYRLEVFEEIVKEGRKFGVFLTIASQRPADISSTIVSQIHNFFIHRLVNERDLFLLDNTISTLDALSRSMIPNLSKGACVVTGTSFDLPMVLQVGILPQGEQPDSGDVNLSSLWG